MTELIRLIVAALAWLASNFFHVEDPVVELLEMIEELGGV